MELTIHRRTSCHGICFTDFPSQKFHHYIRGHQKGEDQTRLTAYQRHGHGSGGHSGHLPQTLGDRTAFQTTQAEFPIEILLWGECKRHQDTNMGNTHCQPAAHGHAKAY